jgi:hypothetical protein
VSLFSPWIEAALLLRIEVAAWAFREDSWAHWTAPLDSGGSPCGAARPFDPGRHAMTPGEPEGLEPASAVRIGEPAARAFVDAVLAQWRPVLHRQPMLGLVSRLDEPRDEFRKRCLGLLRPLLNRTGTSGEELAEKLARVAADIASVSIGREEIAVRHAEVGVVWYPAGREPATTAVDLMTTGTARGGR